jgi:hypothetical protein
MYQGTLPESQTCDNCLTIMRGEPIDKRHGAELQGFSKRRDLIINYAWIVIDSKIRKPKPLSAIVAHELGHSLGLLDCYSCKRKSTAMNQFTAIQLFQINSINWLNDLASPTTCDLAQVKGAYKELKRYVRPSPTFSPSVAADEGEEPEEDDTPVVIPEP